MKSDISLSSTAVLSPLCLVLLNLATVNSESDLLTKGSKDGDPIVEIEHQEEFTSLVLVAVEANKNEERRCELSKRR